MQACNGTRVLQQMQTCKGMRVLQQMQDFLES
jgi:hypothetical protein